MKKSRSMRSLSPMLPLALAVAVQALFAPATVAGEVVDYSPGSGYPLAIVNGVADSLAPSGSSSGKSTSLSGNSVSLSSSSVSRFVFGAINISDTDTVSNNQVFINSGVQVSGGVYGGYSNDGAVTENYVTINDGVVSGSAYGGYSGAGNVLNNTANISGFVGSNVMGGYSVSTGNATGNTVRISGSGTTVGGDAYGAQSIDGHADNNTLTMESGTVVDGEVYGGSSLHGSASNNTVNISNSHIGTNVIGGWGENADITGNTVTINGSAVSQDVWGGHSYTGNANDNTIHITGGTVGRHIYGGESRDQNARNNTVTVSGGSVNGDIYGGHSNFSEATGNTVNINGSVGGYVYGGYGRGGATGNTVTFSGGSVASDVFGGDSGGVGDAFTGNTLNVKAAGLSVGGALKNFQYLNFYVPTTVAANTTLLTVGGEANLTNGAGGSSIVNVAIAGGSTPLTAGDSITLIDAGTLTTASGLNTTANGQGMQGISLQYEFDIVADTASNKLLATVTSAEVPVQTKALSEGRAAGAGFVTQGAEMLTGVGMQSMQSASASNSNAAFGAIQGSSQRIKTGSHVDVDGFSLLAGAAVHNAFNQPNLSMGVFFEAGWGNYDSYNSFSNAASVHGDGDTNYYGVGLMGKLGLANDFYVDGSLRIGRVETDFNSGDFVKTYGQSISYDSKSTYTGASIGLGKIIKLDEQKNLDLYTRYLWTHVNSDSVKIVSDTFDFDAVNSHRLRAGLRFTQQYSPTSSFFAGAAYDYEFDGDAKGSVHGYRLDTPSLGGGTGIFEVGMTLRPQNNDRLSVDVGLQGYVGQREGVSGGVKVNYAF